MAFHLLLFLAWPTLTTPSLEGGRFHGAAPLQLIALGPFEQTGLRFAPVPRSSAEEPDPEGVEEEATEAEDEGAADARPGGERREEALRRVASLAPGVLDRRPDRPLDTVAEEAEEEEPAAGDGSAAEDSEDEDVRVRSVASELDMSRLSEDELLRLERLSALQPELAFGSLSHWLEVQNPTEVVDFMRRRFGTAAEDEPRRTMVVALWVDETGSVEWAEISRSSGRSDLDESALELFREVVSLRPARERGLSVPTAAIYWLRW